MLEYKFPECATKVEKMQTTMRPLFDTLPAAQASALHIQNNPSR
jgi:hypothetical protein